jgi:cytochrome c5
MNRLCIFATLLLCLISGQVLRAASSQSQSEKPQSEQNNSKQAQPSQSRQTDPDQVFNTHCVRCHTPPMSISPRITGTVIMHMRARARLSREDEILLLKYMAP